MKLYKWSTVGIVILALALLLTSCVPESQYENLKNQYENLQNENANLQTLNCNLQAELDTTAEELAKIKAICPPRDFPSFNVLNTWVKEHIQPSQQYADFWYAEALKVQAEAAADGYLVSACIEEVGKVFIVYNMAVVNGQLWWWNPEDGVLFQHPIPALK